MTPNFNKRYFIYCCLSISPSVHVCHACVTLALSIILSVRHCHCDADVTQHDGHIYMPIYGDP